MADYSFVETGPNSLRYEVRCTRCGESYCEVHDPMTPDFSAAIEAFTPPLPVAQPTTFEMRRRQATAWLADVGTRTATLTVRVTTRITQAAKRIRR